MYKEKIRDFHFQNVLWRVVKSAEKKLNKEIMKTAETYLMFHHIIQIQKPFLKATGFLQN